MEIWPSDWKNTSHDTFFNVLDELNKLENENDKTKDKLGLSCAKLRSALASWQLAFVWLYVQRSVQQEESKFFIGGRKKFGGGGESECGMTHSNQKN